MHVLDLRFNAKKDCATSKLLDRIAYEIREPFNEFVGTLSDQNASSIDWWVSAPASRNTLDSKLFYNCCTLELVKEVVKKKKIRTVLVDSLALQKVVKQVLKNEVHRVIVKARINPLLMIKKLLRPFYLSGFMATELLLTKYAAFKSKRCDIPGISKPISLIDTFLLENGIDKDRYYPGLLDHLSKEEKSNIYFVPTIVNIKFRKIIRFISDIRQSQRQFLLKDDFLKLPDYVYALAFIWRSLRITITPCYFKGIDCSALVRAELRSLTGASSAIHALLNYKFSYRLKEKRVKINTIINWFENQAVDKGWNAGFNKTYPLTRRVGYQGFIASPHYLCTFPTSYEDKHGLIPESVAVTGSKYLTERNEFCKDLKMTKAPAFRFQNVWEEKEKNSNSESFKILISLPIGFGEASELLTLVSKSKEDQSLNNSVFWIKPHPTNVTKIIEKFKRNLSIGFKFVEGDFGDLLKNSDLLISNNSSTCLEALARSIPVIIVGSNQGLTHNPIPGSIPNDIWRLCYDEREITEAISSFARAISNSNQKYLSLGMKIRNDYFHPVSRQSVLELLNISTQKVIFENTSCSESSY